MIRNVVVGRLRDGADEQLLAEGLEGVAGLSIDGMVAVEVGRDAGLREGNWDYVITADFTGPAAYRAYDEDAEHNRLRAECFAPVSEQIVRIQFEL